MQIYILVQMISHFLRVFILGVKDLTIVFIFAHSRSALKHDTIDTQSSKNILILSAGKSDQIIMSNPICPECK